MIGGKLRYTGLRGEVIEDEITAETDTVSHSIHSHLEVCEVQFAGKQGRRMMTMTGGEPGYDLIDNEILAGLQLFRLAGSDHYPQEVSKLTGYSADGPESFALLEPYRGVPVGDVAGKLLTADRRRFQVSLLTGLRWLGMAGVAHRSIGPRTIRWDEESHKAQITDFAQATIFGVPRQSVGIPPWAAPEQRVNRTSGEVGERDDIWAAGRLIFYVLTGEEPGDRDSIMREPELAQFLEGVFGPPEDRPTCRELLVSRLGCKDPVPGQRPEDPVLARGRTEFWEHYNSRHAKASNVVTTHTEGSTAGVSRRRKLGFIFSAFGAIFVILAIVIIHIAG